MGERCQPGSIMALALDESDQVVLQWLQERGQATIQELCDTLSVTATAIRQRLNRLQDMGLIDREAVRAQRGRPHHAYVLTETGREQLGDNYAELALLLWEEIRQLEDSTLRERLFTRIERQLAQRYGAMVQGKTLEQRFEQLRNSLKERGFRVEVITGNGLPILRELNCPYHRLAVSDPEICRVEQRVFEQVLGVKLTLAQSCREGKGCCEFHMTEPLAEESQETCGLRSE
jgi:predicted ArsR family transcriptional regulator